ncbi:hypothetical protein PGT21_000822 [Puccinia graminis f. sp. tritici]|uniref:Golgi to ER traffic-protein n=1 Tax=Puccinia graminis f. sp. tritici TaxID=56615 RepID=A0A5B0MDS7_PUCGR|nr:hypothetical protein PGT21_000822 [Puccinia graminis f. sp. tritici]
MEFGWYAKKMLDTITLNFLKTVSAEKETQEKTRFLFVDGGKWAFLQDAIADTKQFGAISRQRPRLLQISDTHPYFNNNTLKINVLSKPIDVKLGGDIRSGSWFLLNFLTCCTSTSSWPDPKSDFGRKMESSISQLIQTAQDSVCALNKKVWPLGPDKSQVEKEKEMNGRSAAKDYLVLKLSAMGACMKNTAETSHHKGLSHLLQKIFEMFLGVVMIYEGYACINLEKNGAAKSDKLYKRGGAMLRDTLNHNNWTTEGQYKAEVQGHEEKSKNWTELKQRSIGALGISIISNQTRPGTHTPWRHMNRFLAETFASAGIGCDNINWYKALVVWDSILDKASVANFFLLDLFEEIESPGKNLCLGNMARLCEKERGTNKTRWLGTGVWVS